MITDKAPVALWSLTWIELDLQKRTLQSTFLFKLDFMFQPHLPNFQEKPQINKEEMVSEFTSFCLKAAFYLSWCLLSSLFVYSTSQPANTISVLCKKKMRREEKMLMQAVSDRSCLVRCKNGLDGRGQHKQVM